MASKKILWMISGIILLLICVILYGYRENFNFSDVQMSGLGKVEKKKDLNPLSKSKVVVTNIHMGIGGDTSVGMELACPYTSSKQYSQLWNNQNKIKSEFLLQVGSRQMKEWVKEKNYRAIKATFRNIVNKYVDDPVTDIYLSKFFVE